MKQEMMNVLVYTIKIRKLRNERISVFFIIFHNMNKEQLSVAKIQKCIWIPMLLLCLSYLNFRWFFTA